MFATAKLLYAHEGRFCTQRLAQVSLTRGVGAEDIPHILTGNVREVPEAVEIGSSWRFVPTTCVFGGHFSDEHGNSIVFE